jgi:hypothetical protein
MTIRTDGLVPIESYWVIGDGVIGDGESAAGSPRRWSRPCSTRRARSWRELSR